MSSLKQQLKKIGTLDLRNVSEASRKQRASFLFSAREAADQDLETIYSIAYNGIMELVILDENFSPFEKTLFSERMKSVDRILQTKEENEKLDASINAFLCQLAPYFLLKPSGKVLEYLIRRFRIQDFNIESIIKCILPYHETKSFVKMVSILSIDDKSPWEFLSPIKKSLLPLERSLLVKKMLKNRYVFDFVCKMVTQSLVPFQTLYSFYVALITDFIKLAPSVNAEMTTALTPHLIDGLKAKKLPELQLASYMIVSQLSSKAVFNKEGVEALADAMMKNFKKSCYGYCLLTVVHLCQTQGSFESMSRSATKAMINNANFEQTILEIADKYVTENFFKCFLKKIAAARESSTISLLETLVLKGYLSSENITLLCQSIMDNYLALTKDEEKAEFVAQYQGLLAKISQRYVEELDVVLENKLASTKDDAVLNKTLYEFTSSAFKGTQHEIIEEANTTLYLCLNSPATTNRLLAIKKLVSIIDDESNPLAQSPEVFETSLAGCLDNFNALLTFAIEEVPHHLLKHVSAEKILRSFNHLLFEERGAINTKDAVAVIKFLLTDFLKVHPDEDAQVARILSVFVFVASSNNLANLLKRIASVGQFKHSPVSKAMVEHVQSAAKAEDKFEVPAKFIKLQADLIKQNKNPVYMEFWIDMVKSQVKAQAILGLLVVSLALSVVTNEKEQYTLGSSALDAVLKAVESQKDLFYSTKLSAGFIGNAGLPSKDTIKQLRNTDDVPASIFVQLAQFTLITLTTSLRRSEAAEINWYKAAQTESYAELVSKLFKTFVSGSSIVAFESAVTQLVQGQLKDDVLRFLTSVWTNSSHSYIVRARALQITSAYFGHYTANHGSKVDFQHLVPALFPTLGDAHQSIRTQGLRCLENIRLVYKSQGLPSGHKVYDTTIPTEEHTKVKTPTDISVLPTSTFYEQAATVSALKTNEAAHLVDFLWYRNDEINKDHSYVTCLFKEYLDLCEHSKEKQHKLRKTHTLTFLLNHVKDAPTLELKISMLAMLDSIDSPLKLQLLSPLLEKTLNQPRTKKSTDLVAYLIRTYLPCNAASLGGKGDHTLALFLRLLANKDTLQGADDDGWQISTRHFALEQITADFFAGADAKARQAIFSSLVDIATNGVQNEVRAAKMVLAKIDVDAKMFDDVLAAVAKNLMGSSAAPAASTSSNKRGRTSATANEASSTAVDLYELVTVLELVESKTISKDETLVKPLFEVLTAMVNADLRDAPVSLEYINQLVMSALTRIIHHTEEKGAQVEESALRVDIVVQCIRITGNPQTHNQALLLMATIASMFPETVLHNIMPVFTFMGANVLRQDDNYSFQVIQQTLEKILPPLVVSSRKSNHDDEVALVLEVKPIIKVFVDALFHIPKHRRLRLFTVLIHTLGEDGFLYAIISLLLEKFTERLAKGARTEAESLTEFSLTISQHFGPETQMKAILALLNGLLVLPNEKSEDVVMDKELYLFNIAEHHAKQLRQYKLATLNFVGQLLTSKGFLSKIMAQGNASEEFSQIMQPFYLQAVEVVLKIVTYFTEYRDAYSVSKDAVPGIAKFWRAILKVVYDVLDKVNALLPLDAFVNVISELIQHNDSAIRRKAMNIFNEKINSFDGHAPEGSEAILVNMIGNFTTVIQKESTSNMASEEDSAVNKQSALLCIASLAKILGNLYPGQFAEAIPIVVSTDALQSSNAQLQISSLVCLTVICNEIGPRAVPHLPKFMPIVTDLLDVTVKAENPNTLLQLGVVSALETIVSVLPHFVSPYITKMLGGLLHPSIYTFDAVHAQKVLIESKTRAVLSQLASSVSPRVLLAPVFAFYETAIQNGKKSTLALCSIVSQAIRAMSRDVMTSHYKQLFKFFLISFDVRRTHSKDFDESDINEIEDAIISAFLDLVMKLNETLFKPLFLKVVDWATVELAVDGFAGSEDSLKRVLFFYKLVDSLLEKLKSIFTPYYGYLIDDVISRLERYKEEEQPVDSLWNYIMSALRKSFLYDNDNLWNATKFEKIVDPVVDQMLVTSKGTSSDYLTRMNTYVVSCVGQMAVTVSNDTLWKPLNHKVLLKTREDDPEIRLAALKCIEEFYIRLGEEWLLFLAESISFLAELMEDDDVRVEKYVQQVNATIETHLGESLDKFFN